MYDSHPRLARKIEIYYVQVLTLHYDLSNVWSLHDIAIKDVDFERRISKVLPLLFLEEEVYVSPVIVLF